jgi:hypothetical protein
VLVERTVPDEQLPLDESDSEIAVEPPKVH